MKLVFQENRMKRPKRRNGHWFFWFYDEVYFANVYVIWNVNEDQRQQFIRRQFKIEPNKSDRNWHMKVSTLYADGRTKFVLSMKDFRFDNQDYCLLAHECLHLAHDVLSERGVLFENHSDAANEAYTYYLQWMMHTICEALKSVRHERIKIKRGDRKRSKQKTRSRRTQKSRKRVQQTRPARH